MLLCCLKTQYLSKFSPLYLDLDCVEDKFCHINVDALIQFHPLPKYFIFKNGRVKNSNNNYLNFSILLCFRVWSYWINSRGDCKMHGSCQNVGTTINITNLKNCQSVFIT